MLLVIEFTSAYDVNNDIYYEESVSGQFVIGWLFGAFVDFLLS